MLAMAYQLSNNAEKAANYYVRMFEFYRDNNKSGIPEMFKAL